VGFDAEFSEGHVGLRNFHEQIAKIIAIDFGDLAHVWRAWQMPASL
jgi:hypothetical protein